MTLAMGWSPDREALRGRVAVVAGATRGAGRGIAAALGEAGATVICTGRTTRSSRSEYDRAETIEETAELVTGLGGTGVAVPADHLDADQVRGLAEQIKRDYGHIDVLVNDIWGGELLTGGPAEWNTPIWEHDLENGLRILRLAVETHLVTSHHLLPLVIDKPGGLLVEVTDGTTEYNASRYRISVFYDLAKVAVNRLAFSQGHELGPYGATAVAITPGWLRSEMMLDNFGVTEENWRDALEPRTPGDGQAAAPSDFALSESPRYVGRAVAALASDPERAKWNQGSVSSGQLALHYGFTDIDGSQPDFWRRSAPPDLHMLNVVVSDMAATLDFYRRLGVAVPDGDDASGVHIQMRMPGGFSLELDTPESARVWHAGWRSDPSSVGVVIGFALPSREAVDERYAELTAAGRVGRQPPFDAFWGARYAIVADPDGNDVGLMSPIEESRRTWPPEPSPDP